jgi:hypothetical protein
VGRAIASDIVVDDKPVSRQHARITLNSSVLSVTDLDGRNGTFVDDQLIRHSQVRMGQVIRFGNAPFVLALLTNAWPASIDDDDETGKRTCDASFGHDNRLTPTQKRFCDLLLEGISEAEVAARLSLSINTVAPESPL